MKTKLFFILIAALLLVSNTWAFESFVVKDIKVNGLQRISLGAVLNGLTLKVGDPIDQKRSAEVIRSLFKSGFYQDISLEREGDVLIVNIKERPAIASISISGNKDIDSDTLTTELKKLGLAENQIFNRSLLDNVEQSLRQQYFSRGKYGMKIKTKVVTKERNRVDISVQIFEGQAALIRRINIVGNKVFDDEKLINSFELAESEDTSFFSDADKYSQPKLRADLETLSSYYLDRGFINFKILSTQVTISPNKKDMFVTINVIEGDKYFVDEISLAGELVIPKDELLKQITAKKGHIFSRKQISLISNRITERLGDVGYAFTNVNAIPDVNENERKVSLTFFIDPGKRVYVRRINVTGNDKTDDEVIRREFRQLEGSWYEPKKLNRTRIRLQRLGFFEDLNIETPQVPGTTDQVDVNLKVAEGSTGTVQGGIGYGEPRGILFNAKVSLNNFVGTGK
ncbi:MAG: outer membrane protein assembly factor BamA, partial [Gammaproteobacteria bacterium]|nr:outer membrane protein assembly factor BamA [Gammaproteobacteria bacterium]